MIFFEISGLSEHLISASSGAAVRVAWHALLSLGSFNIDSSEFTNGRMVA